MKMIYQGSVKNLFQVNENVLFQYSDRYSLFDWGEMPDHLEQKGMALAMMGHLFFIAMEREGIPHHHLSMGNEAGEKVPFSPQRHLLVKKVPVKAPQKTSSGYDYAFYATRPEEGLVPLEVIFRFGITRGSSLLKRAKENPLLLTQWGLTSIKEGDLYDLPLIDFSTKLEPGDRYLTHHEAQTIAGLSDEEFKSLMSITTHSAIVVKKLIQSTGLELWDGKLEWAFTPGVQRSFMLVDSVGLDELRVERNGVSLSKEFLREYYRTTDWFKKLTDLKQKGETHLHELCGEPPHLPVELKEQAENLYLSFTNDLSEVVTGERIFHEGLTMKKWPEVTR